MYCNGRGWEETPLRLSLLISATNCDQAPLLRNNDVIEIPERAHPLGDSDLGKGTALWPLITNCLYTARYTFVIAGSTMYCRWFQSQAQSLSPGPPPVAGSQPRMAENTITITMPSQ